MTTITFTDAELSLLMAAVHHASLFDRDKYFPCLKQLSNAKDPMKAVGISHTVEPEHRNNNHKYRI